MFAIREVPQASTGFSPFELLYGRQSRGVLDVLREAWEEGPTNVKNAIQYVLDLREKLHTLGRLKMEKFGKNTSLNNKPLRGRTSPSQYM